MPLTPREQELLSGIKQGLQRDKVNTVNTCVVQFGNGKYLTNRKDSGHLTEDPDRATRFVTHASARRAVMLVTELSEVYKIVNEGDI